MSTSKSEVAANPKAIKKQRLRAKTATRTPTKSAARSVSKTRDAITTLRAEHTLANGLFSVYEKPRSVLKKKLLVAQMRTETIMHAQVEEKSPYPSFKAALPDKELQPEASVGHATLKELISQVKGKELSGKMVVAQITVLFEYFKHHAQNKKVKPQMATKVKRLGFMSSVEDTIGIAA